MTTLLRPTSDALSTDYDPKDLEKLNDLERSLSGHLIRLEELPDVLTGLGEAKWEGEPLCSASGIEVLTQIESLRLQLSDLLGSIQEEVLGRILLSTPDS